jgi:hypothetical protein
MIGGNANLTLAGLKKYFATHKKISQFCQSAVTDRLPAALGTGFWLYPQP